MSAAAFARQQGIGYTTFCGWRHRQAKAPPAPAFVEVEVPAPAAAQSQSSFLPVHPRQIAPPAALYLSNSGTRKVWPQLSPSGSPWSPRSEMSSRESRDNGFATATLELRSGYPAYFYAGGDGEFICAMNRQFGVPIRTFGDNAPDLDWMVGFNLGVKTHIEQYGLPWNSRLASTDILADLAGYFGRNAAKAVRLSIYEPPWISWLASLGIPASLAAYFRRQTAKVMHSRSNGAAFAPDGFGFSLTLEQETKRSFIRFGPSMTFDEEVNDVSIKLQSDSLFRDPRIVPNAMMAYRSGPPCAPIPTSPSPPAIGPGTKLVWLRFFENARRVECLPAPAGSHLVVFRFSDFAPSSWRPPQGHERFAALDTQLADWIPSARFTPLLEWERK